MSSAHRRRQSRSRRRRRPTPPAAPAPHCAPLVDNVLLLLVSDRPNQFLCHYFESALLQGLSPTVLGWDTSAWAHPERKPWTYYLGGKLILPLEYLEKCAYPDETLVLFTDHDVVFQVSPPPATSRLTSRDLP